MPIEFERCTEDDRVTEQHADMAADDRRSRDMEKEPALEMNLDTAPRQQTTAAFDEYAS
jgi:hypothetical protein